MEDKNPFEAKTITDPEARLLLQNLKQKQEEDKRLVINYIATFLLGMAVGIWTCLIVASF